MARGSRAASEDDAGTGLPASSEPQTGDAGHLHGSPSTSSSATSGSPWSPVEDIVPDYVLRAEVRAWTERIGVQPREVHIRRMTTKWGSCSSSGRLTLNAELYRQPASFRAEVIVHELLHLRYPHHGALFHSLLRAYLKTDGT